MKPILKSPLWIFMGVFLALSSGVGQAGGSPSVDNGGYAALLNTFVRDGRVDYDGLKKNEARLDTYLTILEKTAPHDLAMKERFAFYINLYNAWTLKLILSGYPDIDSIKDLGSLFSSPWKKELVRVGGQVVTLDHIEHDILRPGFRDPRVHFAINCAARGCPPLLGEPYTGSRLDDQLDRVTTAFINDPRSTYLEGNLLYLSRIFKWFTEDFGNDPVGFVRRYAQGPLEAALAAKPSPEIRYLDYDWSLNRR